MWVAAETSASAATSLASVPAGSQVGSHSGSTATVACGHWWKRKPLAEPSQGPGLGDIASGDGQHGFSSLVDIGRVGVPRTWLSRWGYSQLGHVAVVGGGLGYPTRTGSAAVYPQGSGEKMSGEVGGLDCARLVEQVAGVVQESEMPTVDLVPVLFTG